MNVFITNALDRGNPFAAIAVVVPGTGLVGLGGYQLKPAGAASGFPYGFAVTPDRPRTWEV